jgi:hypothetical protein
MRLYSLDYAVNIPFLRNFEIDWVIGIYVKYAIRYPTIHYVLITF